MRAASVAGVRHRLAGCGPEDAFAWRAPSRVTDPTAADGDGVVEGTVVLAVADGVGSVTGSAAASAAAVVAACDAASHDLARLGGPSAAEDAAFWPPVFAAADAAVGRAGGATTLVVAVVGADGRGTVARVGDSTALLLDRGQWIEVWPADRDEDGPVSTATAALPVATGSTPAVTLAGISMGDGVALVLATDGVADPLRDGPTTVAPALAEALADVPSPLGLALLADFSRQGCFDDRTIVGLWSRPARIIPADDRPAGTAVDQPA